MIQTQNLKHYDLEDRTFKFAIEVKNIIKTLPRTLSNIEYGKQLIRSSASVGANYIEANESLSKKDFIMRIMICRKEAKESEYWLKLIDILDNQEFQKNALIKESVELRKIFGKIIENSRKV